MNTVNPNEDLRTIREIMERSSKFLSLSGLAGIFAGFCALAGAVVAWLFILDPANVLYGNSIPGLDDGSAHTTTLKLVLVAVLVLVLAVSGAVFFSSGKARKAGQQFWNHTTRRVIVHFLIPLTTGGIFILILLMKDNLSLVVPAMLIFYGLSLINAGKFTFGEIHYLGLTQVALGLLATVFDGYLLFFWTLGFGLMHIIYGTVMYYRHER